MADTASPPASASFQTLPAEILDLILLWSIRICKDQKNTVLQQRFVCKAFDKSLRKNLLSTIQLDFPRCLRTARKPRLEDLEGRLGDLCEGLYLNMISVRGEFEVARLASIFQDFTSNKKVSREFTPILSNFERHCFGNRSFTQEDLRSRLQDIVHRTPNLSKVRINLPFQIVGFPSFSTYDHVATQILAISLSCLASRPNEDSDAPHKPIRTLIIDHLTDKTISKIFENPIDLRNVISIFLNLSHLVLTIKREEPDEQEQANFSKNLWFMLRQCSALQSLCLQGWNPPRDTNTRISAMVAEGMTLDDWLLISLPYSPIENTQSRQPLTTLKSLELKRLNVTGRSLIRMLTEFAPSLKELYLNEVFLKTFHSFDGRTSSWLGHFHSNGVMMQKNEAFCWVAPEIREIPDLNLDILRATTLGYDDFDPPSNATLSSVYPDIRDPLNQKRNLDQRFVQAVMGLEADGQLQVEEYDAKTYLEWNRNPTSKWRQDGIDGLFLNNSDDAVKSFRDLIKMVDRATAIIRENVEDAGRLTFQ